VVLLAAHAVSAATTAPHFLSYFNLAAGGTANGHRWLIDSNYDWGTNDRFLRRHVEATGLPYQIDPYAFRPVDGPILVNANALYGVLNGEEKAYAWLRRFEPVRRVARTWFEYDVPPGTFPPAPEDDEARRQLLADLEAMRLSGIEHPRPATLVARGFAELGAYDLAFRELRGIAARWPDYAPALHLAGELMVRWKLGVLVFHGREYLDGFRTPRPDPRAAVDFEQTAALARRSGMSAAAARLRAELGLFLMESGDPAGAARRWREALRLDPGNEVAREMLRRAGATP